MLLNRRSAMPLAAALRSGTLTLGEAFTFLSGLYFRGKLTYARTFGRPENATHVITPTRGLRPPDMPVTPALLKEFASVDVSADEPRYRRPLARDLARLAADLDPAARVILLGSVATGKYIDLLAAALGPRLHYPVAFVGRGDMSRGGLLLRSAAAVSELEYVGLDPGAPRRGPRPPKLAPIARTPRAD